MNEDDEKYVFDIALLTAQRFEKLEEKVAKLHNAMKITTQMLELIVQELYSDKDIAE